MDESKSWQEEIHVYEIIDMRKHPCKNYVTGRWVLTIKRDKEGNFENVRLDGSCEDSWIDRAIPFKRIRPLQRDQASD